MSPAAAFPASAPASPSDSECRSVPLVGGGHALVSACDYDAVRGHSWRPRFTRGLRYAEARIAGRTVLLHRLILQAQPGASVDHANGDGWDNRRENLRLATHAQNMANKRRPVTNTSGFKGVYLHKRSPTKPFVAMVRHMGRCVFWGAFATAEEAARAYDKAAKQAFGEFARTNFPTRQQADRPF